MLGLAKQRPCFLCRTLHSVTGLMSRGPLRQSIVAEASLPLKYDSEVHKLYISEVSQLRVSLPGLLDDLEKSISKWKISEQERATGAVVDPLSPSAVPKELPTSHHIEGVKKEARIGGKYKRPLFKRERIRKRHWRKRRRENRHKVNSFIYCQRLFYNSVS